MPADLRLYWAPRLTGQSASDRQERGDTLRVAAVQLNSTAQKERNLDVAEILVRGAAADGADLVPRPERWNLLGRGGELVAGAEPLDGPTLNAVRGWARELGI